MSRPPDKDKDKGGCFAAKMGFCGVLVSCISISINQPRPFPKCRAAAADLTGRKTCQNKFHE